MAKVGREASSLDRIGMVGKPIVGQKPLAVLTEQRAAAKAIHLVIERRDSNPRPPA
jgi:hypothetical protein